MQGLVLICPRRGYFLCEVHSQGYTLQGRLVGFERQIRSLLLGGVSILMALWLERFFPLEDLVLFSSCADGLEMYRWPTLGRQGYRKPVSSAERCSGPWTLS